MDLQPLSLFYNTVRFLKPRQIVYRLKYALAHRMPGKKALFAGLNAHPRPDYKGLQPHAEWLPRETVDADLIRRRCFRFLNSSTSFPHEIEWSATHQDRLWTYNLHYFDYLLPAGGLDPATADDLMLDWLAQNPAGTPDAWDPFPTSLRIVNWLKYAGVAKARLPEAVVASLCHQCAWLEGRIEYHLLANHLFKNAKALIFAGLAFSGGDAERWRLKGMRIVEDQLDEQILADGGHFERSPMYHSMIFEDVLDLLNILPKEASWFRLRKLLREAVDRMAAFLDAMTHPDGDIALFNDAAFNIEASPRQLIDYYQRVTGAVFKPQRACLTAFTDSGYFILAPTADDRLIIDCGAVGPDYQPGHCHCDTLSFELSLGARRVIVDSGCYQYTDSDIRKYNRGNLGHNGLTIDGRNQSEIWGAHRCARRAFPIDPKLDKGENGSLIFEGAHDGYRRLSGRPLHHRRVQWRGPRIVIRDEVTGCGRHDVESRLHLHPDFTPVLKDERLFVYGGEQLIMTLSAGDAAPILIEEGWYCPEFGLKFKCPVLIQRYADRDLPLRTQWFIESHFSPQS
jgi:uncharacterized heparinase superfamily protein